MLQPCWPRPGFSTYTKMAGQQVRGADPHPTHLAHVCFMVYARLKSTGMYYRNKYIRNKNQQALQFVPQGRCANRAEQN